MRAPSVTTFMSSFTFLSRVFRLGVPLVASGVVLVLVTVVSADLPGGAQCVEPASCLAQAVQSLTQQDQETATRLLQDLIDQFSGTPWGGRAELLLGKWYQEQGDRQAVPYLVAAPAHLPALGDYAHFYLGEAGMKRGDYNGAATAFDLLVERYPDSVLRPPALARAAEAWFLADDCRRARERQAQFLSEYSSHALAPAVLLRHGECLEKVGDTAGAVATYQRIWTQYAAASQADDAAVRLERLRSEGVAIPELTGGERWVRAKTLFDAGQYPKAVKACEEILKGTPGGTHREQARLTLGIAQVRLKRYEDARASFEQLAKSGTNGLAQEAINWLGRIFLRLGLDEPFLALAREVEAGRLSGEAKAKFLLMLAAQHADRGRTDQAIQTYQQVGRKEKPESLAAEGYWRAGWLLYKSGRYEEAGRSFDQAVQLQPDGPVRLAALYWKGRSLEKAGEPQKAAALFAALCTEAPLTYYCHTARARAGGAAMTNIVGGDGDSGSFPGLDPQDKTVTTDVHYQRAVELRMVGLLREAGEELGMLPGRIGGDRRAILWLAGLFKEVGEYYRALKLVQLFFPDVIDRGVTGVPAAFWELAYPQGLLPVIQTVADHGVDPHLVAAIIREESTYNPSAVSPAGALGLMQVTPQTAEMIAHRLGAEAFNRDRLFDPTYNIKLGSRYLGQLGEKFNHNPIYTIAAYNAGPDIVSKWAQQFGGSDPDEFIETIPYTETRLYVKRVLRTYREYKRVSGLECAASFFEKGC
ncbi:MAG: tetratricopeptide repeat protein [Nitrospirae bacterium]|nr:MAG: tetratricopeptide repeat protein [Nitrospirota bacterium]